jgi:hypothetical protein
MDETKSSKVTAKRVARLPALKQALKHQAWRLGVMLLPYVMAVGLGEALLLTLSLGYRNLGQICRQGQSWVWGLIAGLLVTSSLGATDRGESWLQLVNYLPFVGYYLVLTHGLSRSSQSEPILTRISQDLLWASLPINGIALLEFGLKVARKVQPALAGQFQLWGWPSDAEPNRAVAMFNHPNFLASYMVLIFGLGLGWTITAQAAAIPQGQRRWIYLGTILSFVGIFCTGSRNALAVAVIQLLVALGLWQGKPWLRWLVLAGLTLVGTVVMGFGVGGRRLTLEVFRQDPRFGLWQIALDLIAQKPWLGWGLGSFKVLYPERLLDPGYPSIAHPHNFWLMLATEAGLPVMIMLTTMTGYITYRAVKLLAQKQLKPYPDVLLAYLLAWGGNTCYALFDVTLFDARINLVNWTVLAGLSWLATGVATGAKRGAVEPPADLALDESIAKPGQTTDGVLGDWNHDSGR